MGIFQQFPYSNFHEFNLDEIIKIMRQMQDEWEATKTEWASYKDFIDNYFENLDLSAEVLSAIRVMAADGSLNTVIDPVIASETAQWLIDHITITQGTTVIDDTLTVAGAAADAKAAGDKINVINKELLAENFFDIITPLPKRNTVHQGVTYTWLDENTCGVSGTATGTSYNAMFTNSNAFPFGMAPGKTYKLKFSSTRVLMQIWFYINGVLPSTPQIATRHDEIFTVPDNATGALIRLALYTGQTAAETVKIRILTRDITDYVTNLGLLPSGDMNDLTGNILGCLNNQETYTNAPFALGLIYNIDFSSILSVQYGFQFTTGQLFYRRKSTTWGPWRDLTNQQNSYLSPGKYVAFGDSITLGAVWNAQDDGQPSHRVTIDWQIPTRIAVAIGMANNFVNMGISGIGFVHKEDNQNIVDVIKAYDFSNTEVITIMGGANDKAMSSIPFGSHNSVAGDGSVCGAIIDILEYMKQSHPKVQVIILQPTPSAAATMSDVWGAVAAGGWSMNDFDREVSQICHDHHAGYANWWECAYCDNWARYNIGYSSGAGPNYTHPVADFDYCILGDFIGGKVSSLFHSSN